MNQKNNITQEIAIFAGGCFWGVEELFRAIPGVIDTTVGYTGGHTMNPVYDQVKTGKSGHAEALEIRFNPGIVGYEKLLKFFFKIHDPTTLNKQGNDIGTQYRSAIFYTSTDQKTTAETIKAKIDASGVWKKPIVTEITPASTFYPAEEDHQDYLQKFPNGYTCHYIRDIDV